MVGIWNAEVKKKFYSTCTFNLYCTWEVQMQHTLNAHEFFFLTRWLSALKLPAPCPPVVVGVGNTAKEM
jgi:hypothetical protein